MFSNWRKTLLSVSAATLLCAAFQSGVVSGQVLSSSGSDNKTRLLWRGTDSSISLWLLDPVQDVVSYKGYPASLGWEPLCIATGDDNFTRLLWKYTDGSTAIWVIDPNLNYVTKKVFLPQANWNPLTISVKPNGQTSVLWKRTDGVIAIWLLDQNLDSLYDKHYGPFPTYDLGK